MSFERIKIDHFENIPYTKKQITDIWNTITGSSVNEQNLVFVRTVFTGLIGGSVNDNIYLNHGELGFLHYTDQHHNSKWKLGFGGVYVDFQNNQNGSVHFKESFFRQIKQDNNVGFFCYSVFKFV